MLNERALRGAFAFTGAGTAPRCVIDIPHTARISAQATPPSKHLTAPHRAAAQGRGQRHLGAGLAVVPSSRPRLTAIVPVIAMPLKFRVGASIDRRFLTGIGTRDARLLILLGIERLITSTRMGW